MSLDRLKVLLVVSLMAATALFVVGVWLEKSESPHIEGRAAVSTPEGGEEEGETGHSEGGEEQGETGHSEGEPNAEQASDSHASFLGVDLEATWLVAAGVAVSLALAALAWLRPELPVLVALVLLGLVFSAADVAEVLHQSNEARLGLAVLAAVVAILHLTTAVTAGLLAGARRTT